jgi:hypothetical protein
MDGDFNVSVRVAVVRKHGPKYVLSV